MYTDGFFFICDHPNGRVTKVDMSGKVIGFFSEPGKGIGQLSSSHVLPIARTVTSLLVNSMGDFRSSPDNNT
ncbi:MAG: hypothetical protein QGH37_05250 [Candidatus Poribacteria bacterium]|nr:hypothetical protein [Candidatus Poribacteria bacterium]